MDVIFAGDTQSGSASGCPAPASKPILNISPSKIRQETDEHIQIRSRNHGACVAGDYHLPEHRSRANPISCMVGLIAANRAYCHRRTSGYNSRILDRFTPADP
jgi:hypothetical protein